ncbi:hypothetical protein [Steroidobacter sp.]|uniref:hypothetical protein n=1 Tax=Steroidobacter sp. TaxID=1978227 RepID=UPI001A4D90A8|nr:hypothetical protein [Steroidobacter sp.]MBL8272130.1 hypothetical protein [Steroidobacter sp.]
MSKPGDKSSQEPPSPDAAPDPTDKRSGRISYDERGNSVWEWQLETGVYSRDISTQRLKKLDLNDLSIADTAVNERPPGIDQSGAKPGAKPAAKPVPGGGFNPYDNSSTPGGKVGTNPYNSAGGGALKPGAKPAAPARKPADLKKLQEWMELRKRVEQNKREDDDD